MTKKIKTISKESGNHPAKKGNKNFFLDGWFPYLWISVLTFIVYFQTLFFDFTSFDDQNQILNKFYFIKDFSNFFKVFSLDMFLTNERLYYRPIYIISYMIDAQISGLNPFSYHFTNILLHVFSSILIFVLLGKLNLKKSFAFVFSLLFAVHPVLVQAVAWVSGRTDSLLTLFLLISFIAFINISENEKNGKSLIFNSVMHFAAFILSLYTKETAVLFPMICLSFVYLIKKEKLFVPKYYLISAVWLLFSVIYFIMRKSATQTGTSSVMDRLHSITDNLEGIIIYLGKIFIPVNLTVWQEAADANLIFGIVSAAVLVFCFYWFGIKDKRKFMFGIIWFVIFLGPTFFHATKTPVFFENRLYLPIVGIIVSISQLKVIEKFPGIGKNLMKFSAAIIIIFGISNISYNSIFKDSITLWKATVESSPNSVIANKNLGNCYLDEGNLIEAENYFRKSVAIDPNYEDAYISLGNLYYNKNIFDLAEKNFLTAIAKNNNNSLTYNNLAGVYYKKNDFIKAADYYSKAISRNQNYFEAITGIGLCYARMNEIEKAKQNWEKALLINHEYPLANYNLGLYYLLKNNKSRAKYFISLAAQKGYKVDPQVLQRLK